VSLRARLAHKPPGYQFTIGKILAIYSGLMVALLLAALDQTIVATALPRVVSDLGGITQYSWVFTAYMLGSTVTVPLYGKLGDAHGRKPLFIVAIVIFLVGSALCGTAQNMWQLVVFRAVQGIGAGGLFPLTLAMVGMIVPPRDRGRYQGLIGSVFAGASIIGPLVGGFIVDNASWRWIFYVNLPVGGLALAVIAVTMPRRSTRQQHSIDWVGAAVLATGTTALLVGLVWGGNQYPWGSPEVVTALAAAAVAALPRPPLRDAVGRDVALETFLQGGICTAASIDPVVQSKPLVLRVIAEAELAVGAVHVARERRGSAEVRCDEDAARTTVRAGARRVRVERAAAHRAAEEAVKAAFDARGDHGAVLRVRLAGTRAGRAGGDEAAEVEPADAEGAVLTRLDDPDPLERVLRPRRAARAVVGRRHLERAEEEGMVAALPVVAVLTALAVVARASVRPRCCGECENRQQQCG
jgi:MFS family permease